MENSTNETSGHMIATAMEVKYQTFINFHSSKIIKYRKGVYNKADAEAYINNWRKNMRKPPLDFGLIDGWNSEKLVPVSHEVAEAKPCVIKAFRVEDIEGGVSISVSLSGYTAVEFLTHFSMMINPPVNVEIKKEEMMG